MKKVEEIFDATIAILSGIWIVSWFLSIWMFPLQFFLTGLFALVLAIGLWPSSREKKGANDAR